MRKQAEMCDDGDSEILGLRRDQVGDPAIEHTLETIGAA